MKTQLLTAARVVNQQWRLDESTGFLRCTVAVLRVDVLRYLPEELEGAPAPGGDGFVRVFVPAEELAAPESVKSLEGMPATVGHIWQDVGTVGASCGNIAGTPVYRDETLFADVLVVDPETVRRIMLPVGDPERLEEISSAYDANVEWTPGIDGAGNPYHGVFRQIRYNHLAILPQGTGRAGSSVRILNNRKGAEMPTTQIRLRATGRTIRVENEDVAAVEELDTKAANAADPAKIQETLDQLAEVNRQMAELGKQKSELEGQVAALQDQLNAAMNPEGIEKAAEEMTEEREDAGKVMNSAGLTLTAEARKLRGHALRLHVVNSVRAARGAQAIEPDKADEAFVRGMFSTMRDVLPKTAPAVPAGHQIVNAKPEGNGAPALNFATNEGRRAALYPHAK